MERMANIEDTIQSDMNANEWEKKTNERMTSNFIVVTDSSKWRDWKRKLQQKKNISIFQ